jgi:hypothetical protein
VIYLELSVGCWVKKTNLLSGLRAMASNKVAENKEQVASKVEQLKGSQPSGSGGKEQPSKSVKESWYEMAM